MPFSSGGFSRFWNELKRRNVLRSLAIYTGTAFVILEASTIIFPRWNFPDWTIDLVLWILIGGVFVNLIIAWFYDLTPEGMQTTRSREEVPEAGIDPGSRGWKAATYISLLVIAALVIFNLLYPHKSLKAGDIQSLVVLPFENYTGDDQLDNMVASMHSLLIGDMGRVSGLRVIGKTSSQLYKEAGMSARDIARELDVDGVVEGTVMCLGDSVCMQFRLVGTRDKEAQLWVGEYNEDKGQILNLYNRVTKRIANEVRINLTEDEQLLLNRDRGADREAMDAYIRSQAYWGDLSPEALDQAERYLKLALEKDPEWASLYGAMAVVWGGRLQMGLCEMDRGRKQVYENLQKANELDPRFSDFHYINAVIKSWTDWDWEQGEREFLLSLAKNPNHALSRMHYAHLLMILQRTDEAQVQARFALELDPKNPLALSLYAVVLKGAGQYPQVLEYLDRALAIDPGHTFTRGQVERALYDNGIFEESLRIQEEALSRMLGAGRVPDLDSIYHQQGKQAAYEVIARLRKENPAVFASNYLGNARDYYRVGWYTLSLDEMEEALEAHNPNLPYVGTGFRYDALHDSARFLAILDYMKLPHPE